MEVTVESTGPFDRTLTVRVGAARINQLLDQELSQLVSTVKLPGFRPGKTPKKLLESRFRDHLLGQVAETLLRETYPKALKEHNLRPADEPEIKPGPMDRNQDFVYVATMQIMPEVEPAGYQGLTLTRRIAKITDGDVDLALDKIREQHARFEAVTGRQAASGDQIVFDFKGFVDDEPFEGGTANGYVLELGSGRFIPGFEDQLIGVSPGEERDVRVTFPEKYAAPHLAGKDALFKCTLSEVRTRVLPPVDDALAALVNIKEGGLAKLREELTESLTREAEGAAEKHLQKQIHTGILAANPLELPSRLVGREQHAMIEQAKKEYQSQGMDPAALGLTDEIMAEGVKETAIKRLSLGLLLGAIANKENLRVDDAQVAARVNQIAASYGAQAKNFKKWLQEDESRMDGIRGSVLEDAVTDWIVANGAVTEEHCTFQELVAGTEES